MIKIYSENDKQGRSRFVIRNMNKVSGVDLPWPHKSRRDGKIIKKFQHYHWPSDLWNWIDKKWPNGIDYFCGTCYTGNTLLRIDKQFKTITNS